MRQAVEDDQDDEDAVVIGTMGWGGTGLLGGAAASSSCEETGDESSCPPVLEEGTTGELEQGSGLDQSSSGPEGPPLPSGSGSGTSSTSHATASAMHGTSRRGAALITPRTAAAHALVPHDVAWMAGLMQTLSQVGAGWVREACLRGPNGSSLQLGMWGAHATHDHTRKCLAHCTLWVFRAPEACAS